MALLVRVESYEGQSLSEWRPAPESLLGKIAEASKYVPMLRWLDPYGQTEFSYYQMKGLVPEIQYLLNEIDDVEIKEFLRYLLEMAKLCEAKIGSSVRFLGD